MKRVINGHGLRVATLALCTAVVGAGSMLAQDAPAATQQDAPQGPPPMRGGPGGRGGPERQLERMTRELNLTPDQVTQIKAIDADTRQQAMALRDDSSTSQDQKHEKMMAVHTASQAKVRGVLTDEQKTKYDAMQARMHERMQNHEGHGGPDGPPPAAPPQ